MKENLKPLGSALGKGESILQEIKEAFHVESTFKPIGLGVSLRDDSMEPFLFF